MDARTAVKAAKDYLQNLLADEGPYNIGLEELEFDDVSGTWLVTLGFSRPWNSTRNALTALTGDAAPRRVYRILTVRASDGEVLSFKRREPRENNE